MRRPSAPSGAWTGADRPAAPPRAPGPVLHPRRPEGPSGEDSEPWWCKRHAPDVHSDRCVGGAAGAVTELYRERPEPPSQRLAETWRTARFVPVVVLLFVDEACFLPLAFFLDAISVQCRA